MHLSFADLDQAPNKIFLSPTFLEKTGFQSLNVKRFWQLISTPLADLTQEIRQSDRSVNNSALFQRHPMVTLSSQEGLVSHLCVDDGFLLDKAGRSIHWILADLVEKECRSDVLARWGMLFEVYVNHLFKTLYYGAGTYVGSPRFEGGDEAFDGCLIEGSNLLAIETKNSVLTAAAKYSQDGELLEREIDKKFIRGTSTERKGIAQLSNSLERFFDGEKLYGIEPQKIRKVFPVLIVSDQTLSAPFMAQYFRTKFNNRRLGRRVKRIVTPVSVIHVSDLELVLPHSQNHKFVSLLESYYKQNGEMPGQFHPGQIPLLSEEQEPGPNPIREELVRFLDKMEADIRQRP